MKLTKRQLKGLVEVFLKEAPLAMGDDDKPSIVVPGGKEEREEFKEKSSEVDGDNLVLEYIDILPSEIIYHFEVLI